ncbi:MAG: GNAT family N-acetyltransferase [Proteobacteria bacterium]|nr:GNAT family N-acetyltransferase [Pseudomonadota bacterium]
MIRSGPKTFELAKMAVTKSSQGNGVGKILMSACLKFAREQEAEQVF